MSQPLYITVVGLDGSGKSAVIERLASPGRVFAECSSHEQMDTLTTPTDVVLQVVDALRLRECLQMTPSFMEHRHPMVIAINRYDLLLQTGHSLDLAAFREQTGVPTLLVSTVTGEGLDELSDILNRAAVDPAMREQERFIVHGWEQTDEDAWHAYMEGLLMQVLIHPEADTSTWEERVNRLLTNKWTGFPIFFAVMAFVFWCTFAIGGPIQDWMQGGVDWLADLINACMPEGWLRSLLADGIVQGVGSLVTALPNIIILFFCLSLIEDIGYTARVNFLMDRVMHLMGLHGRSFFPLLMGFDCNVPAIIAARDTIPNPKNRAVTMLMVPFMSCSARLPVYILLISTFFKSHHALILGSLYLLGMLLSFVMAFILKKTKWFRTTEDDCVNELPDFHLPSLRSITGHVWFRVKDFLKKITTVVLCASVIIWALEFFPAGNVTDIEHSWLAAIGRWLEPVMAPLGFDWRMCVCLMTGIPAKEAIAATFAILFGNDLTAMALAPGTAYAFLVFILLYFPCVATVSTLRKEVGWRWAMFSVVNSLIVAWVAAFVCNLLL
ncbi:MAG: ferrous iron transport protein B [Paludibacteraceae bacterium]|jgi:ferrous iron transporter FeoB|nr:ferrous iron transport protein B [Paludibacteraceae bacterium]